MRGTVALLALIGIRGWAAWDDIADYDVPPRLLEATRPIPPVGAPDARGIVEVELAIGRDGRVETVTVVRAAPALDDAVVRAVCAWRFEPALRKGVPVRSLASAPAVFDGALTPARGLVGARLGVVGTDREPVACPR